jgi:rod shape determining protein RodA
MKQRNPTITKGIDTSLIWIYLLLVVIGIIAIFSATYKEGDPFIQSFFGFKTDYSKQFYFFIASIMLGVFILLTDSKFFSATANLWYAFGILLLLLVFPFHTSVKGTDSIIRIGGFQFQPAEFCKICVCLSLAKYLSRPDTEFVRTRSQLIATALVVTPALITIAQKETGLALVYFSFFIVMYREGLPSTILIVGFSLSVLVVATLLLEKNTLAILITAIAVLSIYLMRRQISRHHRLLINIVLVWGICVGIQRFGVPFLFRHIFQPHQVDRIFSTIGRDMPAEYIRPVEIVVSEPGTKKKDPDYNVKQSKIAIGSGRIFGKGLLKGTQTRYDFVPEQRTDFIFCTIGEGFGFTGSIVLLAIYLVLLFRIVALAERQRSVFSRCYAYGVASVFFFHIVINLAMTVGLAPVIGIPLPFVSYGGTSLLTFTILLFILVRLDADRQMVLR